MRKIVVHMQTTLNNRIANAEGGLWEPFAFGEPEQALLLSCGPETLGPLASTPNLIDEYLIVVHPAVIAAGPQMFDHLTIDLALEMAEAKVFDGEAVVLRYRVLAS